MASGEAFELEVRAKPENLARIAAFISRLTERWGLGPRESFDVQMAVDEACTNIIEHGYGGAESGTIEISCQQTDDGCEITIRDFGRAFDPNAVPEPDVEAPLEERPIGGLGLFFMRRLMDDVHFEFDEEQGNVLTMTKRRKPVVTWEPADAKNVRVVAPRGRLDADLAQELQSALEESMAEGFYDLVIDFRNTTYISSSGLRILLVAVRRTRSHNGDVKLFGMKPQVRKVFNMSGFDLLFSIFDTEKEAIRAFSDATQGQPSNQPT